MAIQSSFPRVADQVITFNKNIVDILTKINTVATTTEPSVNVQIFDDNGVLRNFAIPSVNSLKAEIDRLNNNINSLYSIDTTGSLIQTSPNTFKKLITVDLNREPAPIRGLGTVNSFKATNNWFFDSMLNPMLSVEIDLSGQVENNVRKVLVRRYIVDFDKDANGAITSAGQSALNSFNQLFRANSTIVITDFENWHRTTPGVTSPTNPKLDEQVFDLEPNELLYEGNFSVLRIQEDRLNRKLFYVLDTLDYLNISTNSIQKLSVGSEVIINRNQTSTRYKVIEISTSESSPRARFEKVEGMEAIPVGIGALKIYSPIIYNKSIRISIGYNERNVVFAKALNTDNNLICRTWSPGTGYWSNDLRLSANSSDNGTTMEQFYTGFVYDYGTVLHDLVAKKVPNKLAVVPEAPALVASNFKVVQINKHLTDTADSNTIKQKHNQLQTLKSEVSQLQQAIMDKNKSTKVEKYQSDSSKKQSSLEVQELIKKKESKSRLAATLTQEIIDISRNPMSKVEPKFRVRGFWTIPSAAISRGTNPQEIVQFRIQYRYVSKDGKETPIETFKVDGTQKTASFSNWIEMKTDTKKRVFDKGTGQYSWSTEDLSATDTPNINQLDLALQSNENIEIRIKSISEAGWPESAVESDWSEILAIAFPDDLNNVLNDNDFILKEATKEDLKNRMDSELATKGLDEHLSDTVTLNNKTYHHDSDKILSGFKDENGVALDLYEYLKKLEDKIKGLEEKIKKAKGELEIVILRNNEEFVVSNGSETTFTIECEDYLDPYKATGVPTGRVYSNNVYVIKDFVVKVKNKSVDSPLGLLSDKNYSSNSTAYNSNSPQVFWVNDHDELITTDTSGQTRTQMDNQFIWSVNYTSITSNSVNKMGENIGNAFNTKLATKSADAAASKTKGTITYNSLTKVLSSPEYNLGYNETTILSFVGNNKSVLENSKWLDTNVTVSSTTKLLTTIHPVTKDLDDLAETNSDKIYTLKSGESSSIIVPLNIYFKLNSLDSNQNGLNYKYVNFNNSKDTVKHIKKVKFALENEAENRPFTFTIKFNINRNKVIFKRPDSNNTPYVTKSIKDSFRPIQFALRSASFRNIRL
jgi:hypothetical protein